MRIIFKLRGVAVNHRAPDGTLSRLGTGRQPTDTVDGLRNLASEIQSSVVQNAVVDEAKLQFAGKLYDQCLERYGEDHYRTRLAVACLGRARGIELNSPV